MRIWRLFPPRTREVQLDEKWAFVGKKQAHCDPDDPADAQRARSRWLARSGNAWAGDFRR